MPRLRIAIRDRRLSCVAWPCAVQYTAVRAYAAQRPAALTSWLRGLNDARVGKALTLLMTGMRNLGRSIVAQEIGTSRNGACGAIQGVGRRGADGVFDSVAYYASCESETQ